MLLQIFLALITLTTLVTAINTTLATTAGYVLPSSGTASTTQFYIGPELASGTGCGVTSLPGGSSASGKQGGGPGYLYAAINQLAFGANPSVSGGGGPGGACGICYSITPMSGGSELAAQKLTFMIVDECPASVSLSGGSHCDTCTTSETWHFDIAVDAMSTDQYNTFFKGVTDGSNWEETSFAQVSCDSAVNPTPSLASWGCISGCENEAVGDGVCASTGSAEWSSLLRETDLKLKKPDEKSQGAM